MAKTEETGLLSGQTARATASTREEAEQRWGTVVASRYRVEDLQAYDGMGALYRARDNEKGEPRALRVLPEIYARDSEVLARFIRDAESAQALKHPNIAQVFDIGKLEDGSVYAVTEFLDGQNVAAILEEDGRVSSGRAVHIASQVSRALGTAHESGIIHRDFKPSNIVLVAQEGDLDFVKVVDFGICSHVDGEPSLTNSQQEMIVGSPDYMAPEQAAGTEATPASDIYALGCVLFEMLTGRVPFLGRNAIDVLMQKGARDAPRITEFVPDVPPALADVVAACLHRQPNQRPPSMRVLEVELLRALEGRRPVQSAVAAALAGTGGLGRGLGESSGDAPLPPPPESAASSSVRGRVPEPSGLSVRSSGVELRPAAVAAAIREASGVTPPPPAAAEPAPAAVVAAVPAPVVPPVVPVATVAAAVTIPDDDPSARSSYAWLWLVLGGAAVTALVLLRPDLVGLAERPSTSSGDPNDVIAVAEAGDEVGDEAGQDLPPDVPPQPPPPVSKDPEVLVARAEMALGEGRYTEPADNNLHAYLQQLAEVAPEHEALAKLRSKASEELLARGREDLAARRAHEAADSLRTLLGLVPDHKDGIALFTEAAVAEGKILRHMQAWDELLPLAEEVVRVSPKNFDANMMHGQALAGLNRWSEAQVAYKAAVALRKSDKTAKAALSEATKKAAGK